MKKLLTMCSSHRRPQCLQRMLDSWEKCTRNEGSRIIVYVDERNPMRAEYERVRLPQKASMEFGPYKTMVQVINYLCEKHPDCDAYHEINDDHVITTEGWDLKMMDAIDRHNSGMAIAYGQTMNMPTSTMHGGKLVRYLGYFFPPEYKHSYVDCWLMEVGVKAGLLTYVDDVLIDHLHPAFGKAARDDTYRAVESDYSAGQKVFAEWKKTRAEKDIRGLIDYAKKLRIVSTVESAPVPEDVAVVMNTHNRVGLLDITVRSYLKTKSRPDKLYIFDDCSDPEELEKIKSVLMRIPEAILITSDKHEGVGRRNLLSLKTVFERGATAAVILDSDCLFAEGWWNAAQRYARSDKLVSLYNSRLHKGDGPFDGLAKKADIGGLGMIITKAVFDKYLKDVSIEPGADTNWDCLLCRKFEGERRPVYACSPCYLQHIGDGHGEHQHIGNTAEDFIGEPIITTFMREHPVSLRYLGTVPYIGFDDNGNTEIRCKEMEVICVSVPKAQQLQSDFPSLWAYVGTVEEGIW